MGLGKKRPRTQYPQTESNYNETADLNPSHDVDTFTNYITRDITLESMDMALWQEFHQRFQISGKTLNLITLDSEISTMQADNLAQFDNIKQYINFPMFTIWRSKTSPLFRVSPTYKPLIYAIPRKKAQGTVYDEYIVNPPQMVKLTYEMKFLTTFRDHTNQFEQLIANYFKGRRGVIQFDFERFEIQMENKDELATLDMVDREGSTGQSLYVLSYEIALTGYLRRAADVQKRERPNSYSLRITEKSNNQPFEIAAVDTSLEEAKSSPDTDKRELT
jgi:hypothetical protein